MAIPVNYFPGVHTFQDALLPPERTDEAVDIGLLIPDNASLAANNGAELAIRIANENGGYKGSPFRLVVRSMEGPWGTGSKQAVDLIFEQEVWALMGSHDGRNAHLVEQAATKTRIVFLSAWSSDPTLSQAFVPWFFSCIPNDMQQANALIEEIYGRRGFKNIGAVADKGYDSNLALKSFVNQTKAANKKEPLQFSYDNSEKDYNDVIDQLQHSGIDCIVLFGQPSSAIKLVQAIGLKRMNLPVFGTMSLLDENAISYPGLKNYEGIVLPSPGHWFIPKGSDFCAAYQKWYGSMPGAVAAYAFDGMNIILEAVRKAGLDRDQIIKTMGTTRHEGVTGIFQFDSKGNRTGTFGLMTIKNGIPVALK